MPRPKAQRYPYILGSLMRCDCGHYLTLASAKSGKYHYYQCTNPKCRKRFRAEKIESAVFDTIRKQPIPENVLDRVMEKIEKAGEEMNRKLSPELQRLPSAISTLEQRRDKITEALIESGPAAKNALTEKLTETEKQLTDIRARMEFLKSQILPSEEIATEARRMVQQIRTIQDAFQESEGPLIQRQAALMYINVISYKGQNEFRIEFNYTQKEVRLKVLDGGPILPPLKTYLLQLREQVSDTYEDFHEYVLPEHAAMYLKNSSGIPYRIKQFLENRCGIVTTKIPTGRDRAISVKDLHSCLHTFCYYTGLYGIPLSIVQSIVGHMTPEMTKI